MKIVPVDESLTDAIAPLVAEFRTVLRKLRRIESVPSTEEAKEELQYYLRAGFPVYAAEREGVYLGYITLRIDEDVVWLEQIYVRPEYRRQGVASLLFEKAEETARAHGEETIYNYVHPNNEAMISFLRSKGYTVLNLIELRKPYTGEKLTEKIAVADHTFDY